MRRNDDILHYVYCILQCFFKFFKFLNLLSLFFNDTVQAYKYNVINVIELQLS